MTVDQERANIRSRLGWIEEEMMRWERERVYHSPGPQRDGAVEMLDRLRAEHKKLTGRLDRIRSQGTLF